MHDVQTGKLLHTFPVEAGTIGGFSGDKKYKDIYYHFVSYLSPGIIYHCDLSETEMTPKVSRCECEPFDKLYAFWNSFRDINNT